MATIPLGERPPQHQQITGLTPFALGFRPFFLVAALAGMLDMVLWLAIWRGMLIAPAYYGQIGWHSHEMLFGYATAVIAGFLLTAVRNWTGIMTLHGRPLAALSLVWLAGRLAPFVPGLPAILIAITDLAFLPLLALVLYSPLMKGKNRVNRLFLPLFGLMAIANLLVHLQALGWYATNGKGATLMVNLILLLLVFVSGRVLPFFTEKVIAGFSPTFHKGRENVLYTALGAWTTLQLLFPNPWLLLLASAGVILGLAWRFWHWHHPGVWRIPILWVLFSGLGWMLIGFILKSMALMGWLADNLATHALTGGAVGVLTLGMMARVALGHTGRDINPVRPVEISFLLLNLAVLMRVFGPLFTPAHYNLWISLSGGMWIICFALFSFYYLPILVKPRADGLPI